MTYRVCARVCPKGGAPIGCTVLLDRCTQACVPRPRPPFAVARHR
jgi:hypothetical protein